VEDVQSARPAKKQGGALRQQGDLMFKEMIETVAAHPFAFILFVLGVSSILVSLSNAWRPKR
jgi:hypothetical protein